MKYWSHMLEVFNLLPQRADKSFLLTLRCLMIGIHGRRPWALVSTMFRTGKAWEFNAMLLGFHVTSWLEQPELEEDEDFAPAVRKWKWGFNYFQKVGKK